MPLLDPHEHGQQDTFARNLAEGAPDFLSISADASAALQVHLCASAGASAEPAAEQSLGTVQGVSKDGKSTSENSSEQI